MDTIIEKSKTSITKFEDFFSTEYKDAIFEALEKYPDERSVVVDYLQLEMFDPDLADLLIEKPEEVIKAAGKAIKNIDTTRKNADLNVRFRNLSNVIPLKDLRSKYIGKFVAVDGIIRKTNEIRPRIINAMFECRSCMRLHEVPQKSNLISEPALCNDCGGRSFRLLQEESEFLDTQTTRLQEPLENLSGGEQPRQINVVLEDDLVDTITPGDIIRITGTLKTVRDEKTKLFKNYIYCNYIEALEQEFEELQISEEDEEKIKKLAKDPDVYNKIINSTAPSIQGYREVKEAIALQLFGGVPKELEDKTRIRGDIHILIVGDPGIGKSQMLKYVSKLAPRGIYTSGKGTSGVGLCVSPESLTFTEEGAFEIGEFVDKNLKEPIEYKQGIYVSKLKKPIRIQTINSTKVSLKISDKIWKLKAPEKLVKLTTQTGKELTLTAQTKVLSIENGELSWKESKRLEENAHVATTRTLKHKGGNVLTLELIKDMDNVVVYGAKSLVKKLINKIKKEKSIKELAQELGVNENSLHHNWTNENAQGNINLNILLKIAKLCSANSKQTVTGLTRKPGYSLEKLSDEIRGFSQYHEHSIKLPKYLNERFLYFAGLMAGDGDIRVTPTGAYSIKFSNSNEELREKFKFLSGELFGVKPKESFQKERVPSIRFHSKIIAHILSRLGIPESTNNRLDISEIIFSLPNKELAAFIRGLFDCDGTVVIRDNGSSSIEFYSTSEKLAKKLQLALLRFGIIAHVRKRKIKGRIAEIKGKKVIKRNDQHVIRISGENIEKFVAPIGFEHPKKKNKLQKLLNKRKKQKANTNIDVIPGIGEIIKEIRSFYGISIKGTYDSNFGQLLEKGNSISRKSLQKVTQYLKSEASIENTRIEMPDEIRLRVGELLDHEELKLSKMNIYDYFKRERRSTKVPFNILVEASKRIKDKKVYTSLVWILSELRAQEETIRKKLQYLESLAYSDILFEKIKKVEIINSPYKYVYDLTVEKSHSFISNGIVVHNTAAAVKDDLGGWSLEAGALVLGDRGNVCVDELDKMRSEDRSAIHEALEQQTISIAKAGIIATLNSRCAMLAAANPKFGRFDRYKSIAEQINLPAPILSRFDLIFIVEDKPNAQKDKKLAEHILNIHKNTSIPFEIDPELLRKYIAYARKQIYTQPSSAKHSGAGPNLLGPRLTQGAIEVLQEFYVGMRGSAEDDDSPVPITARQLEALVRLSEANCKIRLGKEVTAEDAKRAIRLQQECMKQVGLDPETGKVDIDKVEGRTPKSERDKARVLLDIIKELSDKYGGRAPVSILTDEMSDRYNVSEDKVLEIINKLKQQGLIFEPQAGYLKIA